MRPRPGATSPGLTTRISRAVAQPRHARLDRDDAIASVAGVPSGPSDDRAGRRRVERRSRAVRAPAPAGAASAAARRGVARRRRRGGVGRGGGDRVPPRLGENREILHAVDPRRVVALGQHRRWRRRRSRSPSSRRRRTARIVGRRDAAPRRACGDRARGEAKESEQFHAIAFVSSSALSRRRSALLGLASLRSAAASSMNGSWQGGEDSVWVIAS